MQFPKNRILILFSIIYNIKYTLLLKSILNINVDYDISTLGDKILPTL